MVRLQFAGSCKSCPSSAVTLELAVEDAVRAAAPEISSIEVVAAEQDPSSGVIPAESLLTPRARATGTATGSWHPVPELADLAAGEVGGFRVAGITVLACRVGDELFAYRDRCGSCDDSLAGARCTVGWRAAARRGAAVPALPRRTSTSCTPVPVSTDRQRISSRSRCWSATACCRWRSRRGGGVMDGTGNVIDVLARIRASRGAPQPAGERCEMCSEPIADEHQHVVNVEGRQLMCVCRGCYLLFTDTEAELRYRAVPDRYLAFPDFALDRRAWEALQIPVGLAFFFRNSTLGRTVAFYPGPAGATESELDLQAWNDIRAADPRVDTLADDTEALLVRVPDDETASPQCLSGAHRCLLRVRRPAAHAVARLRRRPGCPRLHRRVLRACSTSRSRVVDRA